MRSLSNVFLDKEESRHLGINTSDHHLEPQTDHHHHSPKCFLNPASVGFVFCKIKVWQKGRELSLSVNNGPFADFCSSTEKKCFLQLWKANIVEHSNVSALFNFQMKNLQKMYFFLVPGLGKEDQLWYYRRKCGHIRSPTPPTPNPMNLSAGPVLFEFLPARRPRGEGMAFMSRTSKHSNVLQQRKGGEKIGAPRNSSF